MQKFQINAHEMKIIMSGSNQQQKLMKLRECGKPETLTITYVRSELVSKQKLNK